MSNLQAQKELLNFINILSVNVRRNNNNKKKNTSVPRIHYELSFSSLSQKRNADSQFQQKHRGTALVNKHWDEEDQYHCSPFNTAPEEKQIFSPAALSSCTGTWEHDVHHLRLSRSIFFFTHLNIIVSLRRMETPKTTKGCFQSHMSGFMGLSLAIRLCQADN